MRKFMRVYAATMLVSGTCLFFRTGYAQAQSPVGAALLPAQSSSVTRGAFSAEAAALYTASLSRLERGRAYLLAIADLQQAVKLEPEQSKYYAALGCAYADRAAIITDAAYRASRNGRDIIKYQNWLKDWTEAQRDSSKPLFGTPRPRPPRLVTKDDQQEYKLSAEQADGVFHDLLISALAAWDKSVLYAMEPTQKAAALYTRAWGLVLFCRRYEWMHGFDGIAQSRDAKLLDRQKATDTFTELTRMFPKDARYWQSLGDSISDEVYKRGDVTLCKAAVPIYLKSLRLNGSNAELWMRVYTLSKNIQADTAEQALRRAAALDTNNALASYAAADLLLKKTVYGEFDTNAKASTRQGLNNIDTALRSGAITRDDIASGRAREKLPPLESESKEETARRLAANPGLPRDNAVALSAVEYLEAGNRIGRLASPAYVPAMPRLLLVAWSLNGKFEPNNFLLTSVFSLGSNIEGFVKVAIQQHHEQQAVRALQTAMRVGYVLMGDLTVKRDALSTMELSQATAGKDISIEACQQLYDFYLAGGDKSNAEKVRGEWMQLYQHWQNFKTAHSQTSKYTYTYE